LHGGSHRRRRLLDFADLLLALLSIRRCVKVEFPKRKTGITHNILQFVLDYGLG
jgi:hypothetical protein